MAMNYAVKYAPMLDERFRLASVTENVINNSYDWTGVQTVRIYSVPTAQMGDYTRDGAARYGAPEELQNAVSELSVKRDRAFTFTIDRGNYEDTAMANSAGEALRRQIDEVVIPEIDQYRIAALSCGAGQYKNGTLSSSNAYEALLDADMALSDAKVVPFGRVAFVSPQFYKLIKLDNAFVKQSDLGQNIAISGAVGMVDNISIVRVPHSYLPKDIDFIVTHPDALVSPQKLAEYKIHDNPPGINGWLVEGRVCYDAFVLEGKMDAVYVHQSGIGILEASAKAAGVGKTKIDMMGFQPGRVYYKTSASATMPSLGDSLTSWSELPADAVIAATDGHKVVLAVADADGKAVLAASTIAVTD